MPNLTLHGWPTVNPTGNQPWIFIRKWCWNWSSNTSATWYEELTHRKDPDSGKGWGQRGKGATEDEMVGLHHQLSGLEFKQNPGDSEGQGSLVCCSPWGQRVGHNWVTELNELNDWSPGAAKKKNLPRLELSTQDVIYPRECFMYSWETIIKNLPQKKAKGQMTSQANSTKTLEMS